MSICNTCAQEPMIPYAAAVEVIGRQHQAMQEMAKAYDKVSEKHRRATEHIKEIKQHDSAEMKRLAVQYAGERIARLTDKMNKWKLEACDEAARADGAEEELRKINARYFSELIPLHDEIDLLSRWATEAQDALEAAAKERDAAIDALEDMRINFANSGNEWSKHHYNLACKVEELKAELKEREDNSEQVRQLQAALVNMTERWQKSEELIKIADKMFEEADAEIEQLRRQQNFWQTEATMQYEEAEKMYAALSDIHDLAAAY